MGIGTKKALITILDDKNKIVYRGYTYGVINLYLKNKKVYKIKICYLNNELSRVFIVNNFNDYEFVFNCSYFASNNNRHNITLLLTDYFYNNLPIMKGDIILNG